MLTPLAIDPPSVSVIPNLGFTVALQFGTFRHWQNYVVRTSKVVYDRFASAPIARRQLSTIHLKIRSASSSASCRVVVKGQGLFSRYPRFEVEIEEEAEDLVRQFETVLKRRRRGLYVWGRRGPDEPRQLFGALVVTTRSYS
jgi:polyphosphate kinase